MLSKEEARILKDRIDMLNLAELKRSANTHVSIIIEHLFKLKYSTNNRSHNEWRAIVRKHKSEIIYLTKWKTPRSNTNIINEMHEELPYLYEDGCCYYKLASKIYKNIEDGIKYIPEECPWTLEELVENNVEDLLFQLPEPKELMVQMQLTPFCIYLDVETGKLEDKIINVQCIKCKRYAQCIADYYGEK